MELRIKYEVAPTDQVMLLQAQIEDGRKKELILTNVSVDLREKLIPFLLSFEAV